MKHLLLILLAFTIAGCGTLASQQEGNFGPYSGVTQDAKQLGELVSSPSCWDRILGTFCAWVDMPMSFAVDTLFLPVSLWGYCSRRC